MKEIIEGVSKLADEEAERSMIKHPLFNSTHEGYAVIKEEIKEAEDELIDVKTNLEEIWRTVKGNNTELTIKYTKHLKKYAVNLAAESIQVAAMCQKFIDSNLREK